RYRNTVQAFSGDRPEWMGTIVDLSTYRGEEILIRLRYIAQTAFAPFKTAGWFVDNFEVYDRLELKGTASLFSAERELASASSSTYVNSDARTTPVVEIDFEEENYFLSPNPVVSILTLGVRSEDREEALLEVVSMDGVVHYSDRVTFGSGYHEEEVNLSTLASGTYVLRIVKPELIQTTRIIKI
ncbi:MAG: T9SS type A sorting domain-containing protein, partial [Bacteroidota bacterium]